MARSSFSFLFLSTLMVIHSGKFNAKFDMNLTDRGCLLAGCHIDKVNRSVIPLLKNCFNELIPKFCFILSRITTREEIKEILRG